MLFRSEEAQVLSQHSLDMLRPTIRKEGSEIWFSRNRRLRTDAVDVFFRQNKGQDGFVSVEINWSDNPWFPDVLKKDMLRDYELDPEMAEHIWGGAYGIQHGAILSRLVDRAEREGRLNDDVAYDADGPGIEISSDLGFRDTSAWWFWQRRIDGYALLDFDKDNGLHAEDWIERLQARLVERGWRLGKIWLPHDAKAKTFQARYTALEQFLSAFGMAKVGLVPLTSKSDQINAARTVIGKCEFHATRCADGIEGLRAWRYDWDEETGTFSREPIHDAASHPSDGFAYGAQTMQFAPAPVVEEVKPLRGLAQMSWDEIMAAQKTKEQRI